MTLHISEYEALGAYTTLQVGGPARYFARVGSVEELEQALQFAEQTAAPVLVLGGGSNVLIGDAGFPGLVIKNEILGRSYERVGQNTVVRAGAGEEWDVLVADTCSRGLWGLENLSAIPGTVGATPIQNVGAYGVEVSSRIIAVRALHIETGEVRTFTNAECVFGYRDSFFKTERGRKWIVTEVSFQLNNEAHPVLSYADLEVLRGESVLTPEIIRASVIRIRSQKFPDWTRVGTAGSFFKNPIITKREAEKLKEQYRELPVYPVDDTHAKVSLGWILDKVCNMKGYTDGEVGLYQQQALVLTNTGTSAAAIVQFANHIAQCVKEKTHINIEPEVHFVNV